jgi:alpha-glucosidase
MTYPGTPMVFAGDELGLVGDNGESARIPMPWSSASTWDQGTLDAYRTLTRLRAGSAALRRGGLRWAHASDDALVFLRENGDERLLVSVRRRAGDPIAVPAVGAREVTNVYGGLSATLTADAALELPGDGPSCQVYQLA